MQSDFARELMVVPGMCDSAGRLGVPNAFTLFMDIATEHASALGIGMRALKERELFWLTARTRLRFHRRPALEEVVCARTWPEPPERSRCYRDYLITQGGKTLIEGRTEWMVMNLKTGRLHPADSVYPEGLAILPDRVLPEPFARLADDFAGAEELDAYTVRSTDIDLGGHMNNAAYARAIAGAFTSAEWNAMDIREMEIAFRAPCFEGETLRLQRRQGDDAVDLRLSRDEKTIALARIICGDGR